MKQLTCIDLFSGCGGLSLGMLRAGFDVRAAIDFNSEAIKVLAWNLGPVRHALDQDLTKFSPEELASMVGADHVDVIVGGPPCQGFSRARQRDGANSGPRLVQDGRRQLYQEFLRYVEFFQPRVFVIENVLGIKEAASGHYFARVQSEARRLGYRVHPQVERAWTFGVPQKRVRQLIIGTSLDIAPFFPAKLARPNRAPASPTLWEAIGDLPPLKAGEGADSVPYDMERRKTHVARHGRRYLHGVLEVSLARALTGHVARPHSDRDLRDFARLLEGENSGQAIRRGVSFEFPYDKASFRDRYTRQHRHRLCSTVVAHLSKDGLMFIHPTQNRSLTPREAARIQSFPDWFELPTSQTQQFKLIGNAVPPLVAEALGHAINSYLRSQDDDHEPKESTVQALIPSNVEEATERLVGLIQVADKRQLFRIAREEFVRGWCSVGFLYPELHPDSALEHGTLTSHATTIEWSKVFRHAPRLMRPFYVHSGWPVAVVPVVKEAWRRFQAGQLEEGEFYCSEAASARLRHASPLTQVRTPAKRRAPA